MRLIDADYVQKALSVFNDHEGIDGHFQNGIRTAKDLVDFAPTIEAEPVRHGHLIGFQNTGFYECSVCKGQFFSPIIIGVKYCQYCGARLDEVSE